MERDVYRLDPMSADGVADAAERLTVGVQGDIGGSALGPSSPGTWKASSSIVLPLRLPGPGYRALDTTTTGQRRREVHVHMLTHGPLLGAVFHF